MNEIDRTRELQLIHQILHRFLPQINLSQSFFIVFNSTRPTHLLTFLAPYFFALPRAFVILTAMRFIVRCRWLLRLRRSRRHRAQLVVRGQRRRDRVRRNASERAHRQTKQRNWATVDPNRRAIVGVHARQQPPPLLVVRWFPPGVRPARRPGHTWPCIQLPSSMHRVPG